MLPLAAHHSLFIVSFRLLSERKGPFVRPLRPINHHQGMHMQWDTVRGSAETCGLPADENRPGKGTSGFFYAPPRQSKRGGWNAASARCTPVSHGCLYCRGKFIRRSGTNEQISSTIQTRGIPASECSPIDFRL